MIAKQLKEDASTWKAQQEVVEAQLTRLEEEMSTWKARQEALQAQLSSTIAKQLEDQASTRKAQQEWDSKLERYRGDGEETILELNNLLDEINESQRSDPVVRMAQFTDLRGIVTKQVRPTQFLLSVVSPMLCRFHSKASDLEQLTKSYVDSFQSNPTVPVHRQQCSCNCHSKPMNEIRIKLDDLESRLSKCMDYQDKSFKRLNRIETSIDQRSKSTNQAMLTRLEKNEDSTRTILTGLSDVTKDHTGSSNFIFYEDNLI